jgi:hypothetical protein
MHRWIAMTLFARDDIHYAHHAELQLLYAILKKTKVAPVKEMFYHWNRHNQGFHSYILHIPCNSTCR